MTYFAGIDGGGSNLHVVIVDAEMQIISQAHRLTVNPSVIGQAKSTMMIQSTLREALAESQLTPTDIAGVGIGIAGVDPHQSRHWLIDTVSAVLPSTHVVPSSENEIVLVGAHGVREGVLIYADNSSIVFGVNSAGKYIQVGGWGYLIGDEGSASWIGLQSLQKITQSVDSRITSTELTNAILRVLNLETANDLMTWLYRQDKLPIREIALLAMLVIELAEVGDEVAQQIVNEAVHQLVGMCETVVQRLSMTAPKIAFAGNLLDKENYFAKRLAQRLNLSDFPRPQYSPVIGAALLARAEITKQINVDR